MRIVETLSGRGRIAVRALLAMFGKKTRPYRIGQHDVVLTYDHRLPDYQAAHRLYDRFLPVLARHAVNGWIVDIGANVGDTAVAMAQECENPILCVEPDARYFALLKENVAPFGSRVHCLQTLVGTGAQSGELTQFAGGSATLSGTGRSEFASLEQIIGERAVALLKIDTDGFDGDVILSGGEALERCELIFWENYFSNDGQLRLLTAAMTKLVDAGFHHAWVFDNFGNLLQEECSLGDMPALNDTIRAGGMRYADVLACRTGGLASARAAITQYKRF